MGRQPTDGCGAPGAEPDYGALRGGEGHDTLTRKTVRHKIAAAGSAPAGDGVGGWGETERYKGRGRGREGERESEGVGGGGVR